LAAPLCSHPVIAPSLVPSLVRAEPARLEVVPDGAAAAACAVAFAAVGVRAAGERIQAEVIVVREHRLRRSHPRLDAPHPAHAPKSSSCTNIERRSSHARPNAPPTVLARKSHRRARTSDAAVGTLARTRPTVLTRKSHRRARTSDAAVGTLARTRPTQLTRRSHRRARTSNTVEGGSLQLRKASPSVAARHNRSHRDRTRPSNLLTPRAGATGEELGMLRGAMLDRDRPLSRSSTYLGYVVGIGQAVFRRTGCSGPSGFVLGR
jgi:hypothetical protein